MKFIFNLFLFSVLIVICGCQVGSGNIPSIFKNGNYTGTFSPGIYSNVNVESFNLTIAYPYSTFQSIGGNLIVQNGQFVSNAICFNGITNSTVSSINNLPIYFNNCTYTNNTFNATYQIILNNVFPTVVQTGTVIYHDN